MIGKRLMTFGENGVSISEMLGQGLQSRFLIGGFFIPWECIVWLIERIL
jgi:hypothetical protein